MKELGKKLILAQASMSKLVKDAKNPHFKSNYATLANVIDVAKDSLGLSGLAVLETTQIEEDKPVQKLVLIDTESGENIESSFPLACKDPSNPQQLGSAQTYARRYLWQAIAGLAPEDDDGNSASTQKPAPKPKPAKPKIGFEQAMKLLGDDFLTCESLDVFDKTITDYGYDPTMISAIPEGEERATIYEVLKGKLKTIKEKA